MIQRWFHYILIGLIASQSMTVIAASPNGIQSKSTQFIEGIHVSPFGLEQSTDETRQNVQGFSCESLVNCNDLNCDCFCQVYLSNFVTWHFFVKNHQSQISYPISTFEIFIGHPYRPPIA